MEEEKESVAHTNLARQIVETLADGEEVVLQQPALQVLKPLLEDHITPAKQKLYPIPEWWFGKKDLVKNELIDEIGNYLKRVKFTETEDFIMDL